MLIRKIGDGNMGVSLLSNCGDYNHYNFLIKYSKRADKIIIISPFLTADMPQILSKMPTIKSIELYTNLDGYGIAATILPAIYRLYEYCREKEISVSVKCNNHLHGKAYLLYKESECKGCIITSGNFTDNGLKNNYEYGVFLENESMQKELVNQIYGLDCLELTYEEVVELNRKSEEFAQKHPAHNIPVFKVSDYIQNKIIMPNTCRYFWKVLGCKERPIVQGYAIIEELEDIGIGFKKKPPRILKGDIIICHSKDVDKVLGYWKVLNDEAKEGTAFEGDRKKCKLTVSCMSKKYSSHWWEYDIKKSDLVKEYNRIKKQEEHITAKDGDTLRGLQRGHVEITKEFAEFVVDSILKV